MAFTQLSPELPVTVIGKGDGLAFAVIDYGEEQNLIWVVALDDSGEIWCSPNPIVRMRSNWTMGRQTPKSDLEHGACGKNATSVGKARTARMDRAPRMDRAQ
jgi:hypothetical protein